MMYIVNKTYKYNGGIAKRKITQKIILHCSATKEGKDYTTDQIHSWHIARKFSGIGYHFVIYRDGTIVRGRPEGAAGAHTVGENHRAIGICYIGGLDSEGHGKDTRTDAQKQSMLELVDYLLDTYGLSIKNVYGHYQYVCKAPKAYSDLSCKSCMNKFGKCKWASKSCPCFPLDTYKNTKGVVVKGFRDEYTDWKKGDEK